jgi:hypothetical protein
MELLKKLRPLAVAAAAAVAIAACDESLDSGAACPALCPEEPADIRDTTIDAVVLDTMIGGFPPLGTEAELALTFRPDTLETAAIVRYDSLPTAFFPDNSASDSLIERVDSAFLKLRVSRSDTLGPSLTIEVFDVDVDSPGEDTAVAVLAPLFVPERLVGSRTFTGTEHRNSLIVPLDTTWLLNRILEPDSTLRRARLGVRVRSASSAEIQVFTSNFFGAPPILYFRVSPDTTNVDAFQLVPKSLTPENRAVANDLADFQIITFGPAAPVANALRVGGIPARRVYMRFDIPSTIIDSSNVIRATLFLTQRPAIDAPRAGDTMAVQPLRVHASRVVTDIAKALLFITISPDSTLLVPADSMVRPFELINQVKAWRRTDTLLTPRAIALRSASEGIDGRFADFFSSEAPEEVRPRLRIWYVPRPAPGLP